MKPYLLFSKKTEQQMLYLTTKNKKTFLFHLGEKKFLFHPDEIESLSFSGDELQEIARNYPFLVAKNNVLVQYLFGDFAKLVYVNLFKDHLDIDGLERQINRQFEETMKEEEAFRKQ